MSESLVSAIIIFLNGKSFISEAIESVLTQSYRNIELILVDDGSTDGSAKIANSYAEKYPEKVKMVGHPDRENRGMSASRNLGVKHSNGQYIAFLDSDDVWLPTKISEQVAIMQQHPEIGLLYGKTQIWYSWSGEPGEPQDFFYNLGVVPDSIYGPRELLRNLIENKYQTPTTCNAMISKKAFMNLGGFVDSFRGLYEDQVFFANLYLSWPTYVASQYWARYRQHPGNVTPKFSRIQYLKQRRKFIRQVYEFSKPHWPKLDETTRNSLTRELWQATHPLLDFIQAKLCSWTNQKPKQSTI